jgi:CheY-like chemotaxis protein
MTKTVLIVDDNEHLRDILASVLRSSGYEISQAATGVEAIEKAISTSPHLILLDLDLPDMKGTDAAWAIRKNSTTAHIPIIGCSAFFGSEWRTEALRAGMVDYLLKLISAEVIKEKIEKFILAGG